MNGFDFELDDLIVNADNRSENRRSLTREEMLVLAWLIFNQKNRSDRRLIADSNLTLEQCETAIRQLMNLDLLRLR